MDYKLTTSEFYCKNIICSPHYFSGNIVSDYQLLIPELYEKYQAIYLAWMHSHPNEPIRIFETYRSMKRQNFVYQQKQSKVKSSGYHHFGCAFDIVFIDNGNPSWNGNYKELQKLAELNGLFKAGSWDLCHFQLFPNCNLDDVRIVCKHSVMAYQRNFDIKIDGIVGPITYKTFRKEFWGMDTSDNLLNLNNTTA